MAKILKLTGTGNTFLLVDLRQKNPHRFFIRLFGNEKRANLAKELCNPYQSIGADGLLFLENSNRADVKWDFYNADGSVAEMCGNAARCVRSYIKRDVSLETQAGIVRISTPQKKYALSRLNRKERNPLFQVGMPQISVYQPNQFVLVAGRRVKFDFVNSGVPHVVVKYPGSRLLNQLPKIVDKLEEIVHNVRQMPRFKKNSGTNVTFYVKKSQGAIEALTFERGVSGYTQACGTGAVAAAQSFVYNKNRQKTPLQMQIIVDVPGGRLLVDLLGEKPQLIGGAKNIAEIKLL